MINAQIAKRGKTVSPKKLRIDAKKFDGTVIDYRQKGYVTEVKDQVRTGPPRCDAPPFGPEIFSFAGLLWLLLGLQHHGGH